MSKDSSKTSIPFDKLDDFIIDVIGRLAKLGLDNREDRVHVLIMVSDLSQKIALAKAAEYNLPFELIENEIEEQRKQSKVHNRPGSAAAAADSEVLNIMEAALRASYEKFAARNVRKTDDRRHSI